MSHGSSIPFPNGFCQIKIGYHQHFGGTPFHHREKPKRAQDNGHSFLFTQKMNYPPTESSHILPQGNLGRIKSSSSKELPCKWIWAFFPKRAIKLDHFPMSNFQHRRAHKCPRFNCLAANSSWIFCRRVGAGAIFLVEVHPLGGTFKMRTLILEENIRSPRATGNLVINKNNCNLFEGFLRKASEGRIHILANPHPSWFQSSFSEMMIKEHRNTKPSRSMKEAFCSKKLLCTFPPPSVFEFPVSILGGPKWLQ